MLVSDIITEFLDNFDDTKPVFPLCCRCGTEVFEKNYHYRRLFSADRLCRPCRKEVKKENAENARREEVERKHLQRLERQEKTAVARAAAKAIKKKNREGVLAAKREARKAEREAKKQKAKQKAKQKELEFMQWYDTNPPRTCKTCGEEKRLYDFVKSKKSGRFIGFVCYRCTALRKRARAKKRQPKEKKVNPPKSAEDKAAARRRYKKTYRKRVKQKATLRINRSLSEVVRQHCRKFKAGKPAGGWQQVVGYSLEELKTYLENRFTLGMSWDNYGEWHIDHIKPKSLFSFTSADDPQFRECWALSNLQPLWAKDNVAKGVEYTPLHESLTELLADFEAY